MQNTPDTNGIQSAANHNMLGKMSNVSKGPRVDELGVRVNQSFIEFHRPVHDWRSNRIEPP